MSRLWRASAVTECRRPTHGFSPPVGIVEAEQGNVVEETWTWRASGLDALKHAFAAESGFVRSYEVSALLVDGCGDCHLHEVEIYRSMCGREVPVAALMPHERGFSCHLCRHLTKAPCAVAA